MLEVSNVTASYDAVPVLGGVSFTIAAGEVVALLGRNGVGKTTLLRTLVGLVPARGGSVRLNDVSIERTKTHAVARLGLVMVPQGRGILGKLTVAENLLAGTRAAGARQPLALDEALELFPALKERLGDRADALSGGQQQQLALARAFICRPKVLLLDEPSEGVQPNIVSQIGRVIRVMSKRDGLAVLLVEQNIELALDTADRCLVMEKGRLVHEGAVKEFRSDAILRRYLAL